MDRACILNCISIWHSWPICIPWKDLLWDQQSTMRGTCTGMTGTVQFVAEKQIIHKPGLREPVFCFTAIIFDITKLHGPSPVLWLALLCSIWTLTLFPLLVSRSPFSLFLCSFLIVIYLFPATPLLYRFLLKCQCFPTLHSQPCSLSILK